MTAELELAGRVRSPDVAIAPDRILDDLEAGRVRAAEPDPTAPDGWRVRPEVKAAILACFADRTTLDWTAGPVDVSRSRRRSPAR